MFSCPRCKNRLVRTQTSDGLFFVCPNCQGRAVGLSVVRMTHFSTALFPLIVAVKLWRKGRAANGNGAQTPSDLRPLSPWLNRALLGIAMTERRVLRHVNLPFGSSLLGIACKGN